MSPYMEYVENQQHILNGDTIVGHYQGPLEDVDCRPGVTVSGYVSDVLCTRKGTFEFETFTTPDSDGATRPLVDVLDHTVSCLYDIPVCRSSGYDILNDVGVVVNGERIHYAEYRLDAELNAQMETLLASTKTTKGFRATITNGVVESAKLNGRVGFKICCGTVTEATDYAEAAQTIVEQGQGQGSDSSTSDADEPVPTEPIEASNHHTTTIVIVLILTISLGAVFGMYLVGQQDNGAAGSGKSANAKGMAEPVNGFAQGGEKSNRKSNPAFEA